MAIFPRTVLSWNVDTADDITESSLSLFIALEPKIEILVIGVSDEEVTRELQTKISSILKPYGIATEILKTETVSVVLNFVSFQCKTISMLTNLNYYHFTGLYYIQFFECRKSICCCCIDSTKEDNIR